MLYKKLSGQDVKTYMQYYDNYKIITNRLNQIFDEEKNEFKNIIMEKK
jgi:hypothetical protein